MTIQLKAAGIYTGLKFAGKEAAVHVGLSICLILWLVMVFFGYSLLLSYQTKPALVTLAPQRWPSDSRLVLDSQHPTLLMIAHPKCPCTRASAHELAVLVARSKQKLKVYVLFLKPKGVVESWEKTDLWSTVAAIPGVHLVTDDGGLEAGRFRATTSGQVLVYDRQGNLLFDGGITGSRGHEGDNAGLDAVQAAVNQVSTPFRITSVFGCSVIDDRALTLEYKLWQK